MPSFLPHRSGALFTAPLPNTQAAPDRAPADRSSKSAALRRRSLLVVEDNPSTRILLAYMLKGDYDVTAAAGFDEAMDRIKETAFDGLVLDINLCENRSGIDLLHAIRQFPHYQHVPAIACTAYSSSGDREHLLEKGFDRYVAKPFTKEQLHHALAVLFDTTNHKAGSGYQA